MKKRYQVLRRIEVGGTTRLVRHGSCDADSADDAVRKIAHATNVPPAQLTAREAGPPLSPVGTGRLP